MASDREQTTIRLPAKLKEELQREAYERGDSFNGFIILLINMGWDLIRKTGQ